jgi:hypothetical protein
MVENKLKERWKAGQWVASHPLRQCQLQRQKFSLRFRRHFSFSCLSKVTEQVSV